MNVEPFGELSQGFLAFRAARATLALKAGE
jgi:hypothetical protein